MKKRLLGKTNLYVSEISFGGVEIGMPYGIGVKNDADMIAENSAVKLLHEAFESGINFFDTARMYGDSERIIGKTFKEKRNDIIISTKCRHFLNNNILPQDSEISRSIEESFYESLEALQTDYIDVYMLHQVNLDLLQNESLCNIFLKLKQEGKIRATGVSTYTVEETQKAIEMGIWDVIQLPLNLLDQRQTVVLEDAKKKNIGLVVRSVLLKGLLSNRGKNLHPALESVENHIKNYDKIIHNTPFSLPTLAIKFALSFLEISTVLVGIDKKEYLTQALIAGDGKYFNEEELKLIKDMAFPNPDFLNLPYWDKMNWL